MAATDPIVAAGHSRQTRRRAAGLLERHAEEIVTLMSAPLVLLDRAGRVRFANRAFELAFCRGGDAAGRMLLALDGRWEEKPLAELLGRIDREGAAIDGVPVAWSGGDGTALTLLVSGRAIGGRPTLRVLLFTDITERLQIEEEVRALQARIMQLSRASALDELASTIAHELNQPLSAVSSYLGAARETVSGRADAAEIAPILDRAAAQLRRAADVLRSLRDSVETGEIERLPQPINDLVAEAVSLAGRGEEEAEVVLDLDPTGPVAPLHRIQMQQIVLNLLRNALDAVAGRAGARVTVATRATAAGLVEISVSDTGPGLGESAEELFRPFFTTKPEGMGLGLTIARTIAERHGGRLVARSRPGGGAEFRVSIPGVEGARDEG